MRSLMMIAFMAAGLSCLAQVKPQSPVASQGEMQRPSVELERPVPMEAHQEAQRSLPELRKLVTEETYGRLGLESPAEINAASLGSAIRVFMVRLDHLQQFTPERSVAELLVDTKQVIYPVTVQGQVRSGVTMRNVEGKWQVASFGRPAFTRALSEIRQRQSETTKSPSESFFEVRIPALNLSFIGQQARGRLLLTSVTTDARFKLEAGQTMDAQQIFSVIAPYARQLKTGPYLSD